MAMTTKSSIKVNPDRSVGRVWRDVFMVLRLVWTSPLSAEAQGQSNPESDVRGRKLEIAARRAGSGSAISEETKMQKPNYQFEKRRKELDKKAKKAEKLRRKNDAPTTPGTDGAEGAAEGAVEGAAEGAVEGAAPVPSTTEPV